MSTFQQIEANRRNALKSTGPKTVAGKEQSRRNAVRHGLTAETVIGLLEDAEDYRQFEAAVIADYDAQSAVERELLLRLASLLWRLRRATTLETGLFEIQAEHLRTYRDAHRPVPDSCYLIQGLFWQCDWVSSDSPTDLRNRVQKIEATTLSGMKSDASAVEFAQCFLRLANLPNLAFDRLSRYEASLWRRAAQILFTLDALDRRKPQERNRFCLKAYERRLPLP